MAGKKNARTADKTAAQENKPRKKSVNSPDTADMPPWDDDVNADVDIPDFGETPKSKKTVKRRTAPIKDKPAPKKAAQSKQTIKSDDDIFLDETPPVKRPSRTSSRTLQRAAPRDDKLTLTVNVDCDGDEQFDLLCDGRAYWGGCEAPYRFEIGLAPGTHDMRIMQRHALNRQPSRFVPLALEVMLGDGLKCEYGPYYAALDARMDISADAKLNVNYEITGRTGRYGGRAAFTCKPGKGLEFDVTDTSMSSTPRLRRRWTAANYAVLAALMLIALSIVALGAYMAVRPGGSIGGGVLIGIMGLALALGCAGAAGAVRAALEGEYAPDIDFPQPKPKRKRAQPGADEKTPEADAPPRADAAKPKRKSTAQKSRAKQDVSVENDYDGAYDDADEMGEFEEAGLSTADLSLEQIRAAKKQLIRKLGGEDEQETERARD